VVVQKEHVLTIDVEELSAISGFVDLTGDPYVSGFDDDYLPYSQNVELESGSTTIVDLSQDDVAENEGLTAMGAALDLPNNQSCEAVVIDDDYMVIDDDIPCSQNIEVVAETTHLVDADGDDDISSSQNVDRIAKRTCLVDDIPGQTVDSSVSDLASVVVKGVDSLPSSEEVVTIVSIKPLSSLDSKQMKEVTSFDGDVQSIIDEVVGNKSNIATFSKVFMNNEKKHEGNDFEKHSFSPKDEDSLTDQPAEPQELALD
jgi:hypothetical protein